jgi:hypothetical protein
VCRFEDFDFVPDGKVEGLFLKNILFKSYVSRNLAARFR